MKGSYANFTRGWLGQWCVRIRKRETRSGARVNFSNTLFGGFSTEKNRKWRLEKAELTKRNEESQRAGYPDPGGGTGGRVDLRFLRRFRGLFRSDRLPPPSPNCL
uniref:Uncharacterized protein n=1 Tax=Photinus pyralis TaxID=7054 RepID=A0A1Y1KAF6_PHOPY